MEPVILKVPETLAVLLRYSVQQGLIAEIKEDGNHLYRFEKALVDRIKGMKIEIYAKEHPPPHFHVTYQGDEAVFALDDGRLIAAHGSSRKIEKNVQLYYEENREKLIAFWNKKRPDDCPVGPVEI